MKKDFDTWNKENKRVHASETNKLYHERQVWWCSLGANIGFEQDGTGDDYQRPVLILRGISRNTCYIVPLTTSTQKHKLRIRIGLVDGKQATALISQIKLIDTKRLVNKLGFIDQKAFVLVRKAAKDLL